MKNHLILINYLILFLDLNHLLALILVKYINSSHVIDLIVLVVLKIILAMLVPNNQPMVMKLFYF